MYALEKVSQSLRFFTSLHHYSLSVFTHMNEHQWTVNYPKTWLKSTFDSIPGILSDREKNETTLHRTCLTAGRRRKDFKESLHGSIWGHSKTDEKHPEERSNQIKEKHALTKENTKPGLISTNTEPDDLQDISENILRTNETNVKFYSKSVCRRSIKQLNRYFVRWCRCDCLK